MILDEDVVSWTIIIVIGMVVINFLITRSGKVKKARKEQASNITNVSTHKLYAAPTKNRSKNKSPQPTWGSTLSSPYRCRCTGGEYKGVIA